MDKNEAIQYFKDHKEDIWNLCEELGLKFPYENKEEVIEQYNILKHTAESWEQHSDWREKVENGGDIYYKLLRELDDMEKTYHIHEPKFEKWENYFIPKEFNKQSHAIFEFRKDMFETQRICEDFELTNIIREDMSYIQLEKGGEEGMYDAFPFSFTQKSIVAEWEEYLDYYKANCKFKREIIRSYTLDGSGGVVIVETRTYSHFEDSSREDGCCTRFQILTLGEDDSYHFLNGARIYETFYGNKDEFIELMENTIKEYKNNKN